jgi:hypothetical protein
VLLHRLESVVRLLLVLPHQKDDLIPVMDGKHRSWRLSWARTVIQRVVGVKKDRTVVTFTVLQLRSSGGSLVEKVIAKDGILEGFGTKLDTWGLIMLRVWVRARCETVTPKRACVCVLRPDFADGNDSLDPRAFVPIPTTQERERERARELLVDDARVVVAAVAGSAMCVVWDPIFEWMYCCGNVRIRSGSRRNGWIVDHPVLGVSG